MPAKVRCKICKSKSKKYDENWISHFLKKEHLFPARVLVAQPLVGRKKYHRRSVVVYGILGIPMEVVLNHFALRTKINNFVYWGSNPNFCVVTFSTVKVQQKVMNNNYFSAIDGVELVIRPRERISSQEWISICPRARITAKKRVLRAKARLQNVKQQKDGYITKHELEDSTDIKKNLLPGKLQKVEVKRVEFTVNTIPKTQMSNNCLVVEKLNDKEEHLEREQKVARKEHVRNLTSATRTRLRAVEEAIAKRKGQRFKLGPADQHF